MRQGHKKFEQLFKTSYQNIYFFLLKKLGSSVDAEDAAQETFLRLSRQNTAAMSSPRSYLYAIARNLASDMLRARNIRSLVVSSSSIEDYPSFSLAPDVELDQMQQQEKLFKALADLPPRCREAFILHRFDNLTYSEISRHMSISSKTVEKHIARAVSKISEQFSLSD